MELHTLFMTQVRSAAGKNPRPTIGRLGLRIPLNLRGQNQIDECAVDWCGQHLQVRVYADRVLVNVHERITQPVDVGGG